MEFVIQICGWAVGLPLEILIIAALLRGLYRGFPWIFAYIVALFLSTVVEIPVNFAYYTGDRQAFRSRAWTYWLNEAILLPLIVLVVLSLIWRATAPLRARRVIRLWLVAGAVSGSAISFWVHYDPHAPAAGAWMTPWTRDLYFGAAVLDLALWALLLVSRDKDRRLLMLSGALGIQFTGEAIGGSARDLAVAAFGGATRTGYAVAFAGNVFVMAANLMCLFLWWQVLRRRFPEPSPGAPSGA